MTSTSSSRDPSTLPPVGDLRAYVTVLRRRKWSVILVTALTVAGALGYSLNQTKQYSSTATVLVRPLDPNEVLGAYNYNFAISMQTEEALVTSPAVSALAAEIAAKNGVTAPDEGSISTDVPTDTTFLDISYTAEDPAQAQGWAQSYAQAYIDNRSLQATASYESAVKGYQGQIDALSADVGTRQDALAIAAPIDKPAIQKEIGALNKRIVVLQAQLAQVPFPSKNSAEFISNAGLPSAPSSPNIRRNLILAAILGLMLGIGVAFVRERLDDRITGREDFQDQIDAPTLAIVPRISGWRKRSTTQIVSRDRPHSAPSEAYRTARTNLEFIARTGDVKVISVTSPNMGEGKSTTTANLAVTLALANKRVLAIDCDLRKPRLHKFFDLDNTVGITSVLKGEATVMQAVQRTGIDTLRVIPSGPIPSNPSELMGDAQVDELISQLRKAADFVIFDTAPVLAVTDALVLSPKTDGVVVVVDASATHRQAVSAVREQLQQVGARILGGIFNNFDPGDAKSYPSNYRYHYYSNYQYKDAEKRKKNSKATSNGGNSNDVSSNGHAPAREGADIWG